jgi:hypothetical protein
MAAITWKGKKFRKRKENWEKDVPASPPRMAAITISQGKGCGMGAGKN